MPLVPLIKSLFHSVMWEWKHSAPTLGGGRWAQAHPTLSSPSPPSSLPSRGIGCLSLLLYLPSPFPAFVLTYDISFGEPTDTHAYAFICFCTHFYVYRNALYYNFVLLYCIYVILLHANTCRWTPTLMEIQYNHSHMCMQSHHVQCHLS